MTEKRNLISMDGNSAAAHVGYAFSDVAAIYPITPSSTMGELCDAWAAEERKNLFGQKVSVAELQSEGGASGAVHGSLVAGAFTTTYTASQGLLLMLPNMNKIAGELLPTVFHVSARSVATHALSIFGDHSDVMHARPTGFAMLASNSVQESMDMALVAHAATIESSIPFIHFFDGFRTSHEIQKIEEIPYSVMASMINWEKVKEFKKRSMRPENPQMRGTAENPDIFFQNRESANKYYNAVPAIVQNVMDKVGKAIGRTYHLFDYFGHAEAEDVIVIMGSGAEAVHEYVEHMNAKGGKYGVLKIRLYRPWSLDHFIKAMPKSAKRIAVLDRTKEPGAVGEPLYLDVCASYHNHETRPLIVGGRYGLSSKEFTPSMIHSVFKNLKAAKPLNGFTVGIEDDVTNLSLPVDEQINSVPEGTISCKFFGLGSDGTVGANKNSIKIIGDNTDFFAQGYFKYDSKKSGGITVSHLRFGPKPIHSTYLVNRPDFVAVHNWSFLGRYDVLENIRENGTFLINSPYSREEVFGHLPVDVQQTIIDRKLRFFTIDAVKIANEVGLGHRINMVMQTAFFKLSEIIPEAQAIAMIKEAIKKTYGSKGDEIVRMNITAVDRSVDATEKVEIPSAVQPENALNIKLSQDVPSIVKDVIRPVVAEHGDNLPVSKMPVDGVFPTATSQYEKRGIAINVPIWQKDTCIQCNQCAFSCPHAVIRPRLYNKEDLVNMPEGFQVAEGKKPYEGKMYKIQISPLDCTGCGVCQDVCPTKQKSLVMEPLIDNLEKEKAFYDYSESIPTPSDITYDCANLKSSQFCQPYFEFSGACAGCGETPYLKLATQICGDRMVIANATGCSSIYGGTAPTSPYCVNDMGHGPAWGNSLFEDNAEYGFGMSLAINQTTLQLTEAVEKAISLGLSGELKGQLEAWLEKRNDIAASQKLRDSIVTLLPAAAGAADGELAAALETIEEKKDYLVKKSVWIIGGDGWAYDIGYGGLDHVLASGANVNVLVLDTEVYSNTGGQSSKATPTGSTAKFATAGKSTKKKDLGLMAMSYGYVYVASVSMGANRVQLLKAMKEAEEYDGPSIIIAYAPCINHGIDMSKSQSEEKLAVDTGYWLLYRYDPRLKEEGKNPLVLDSKEPTMTYREFLDNETRYKSLTKIFPERAEELFKRAAEEASERREYYKKLASM
ncbi:MAG: pyruvate:ferredoxin (flavodoxin) oxidoreductase [Candidatus Wallbacteria bacterium HGW-Wallbacteria-1]|jgi:pyruvate-ferredoxin/flavodoxin oxidoreductase|uniref:Pyruvate:ferredoxin (Flavodoxin) oxidoreductase n=1 Tax=Candidatus Wallbacteria bacterium HGW-Wallbacteria-1 TaxID=2013854 RepID=A0A2N1PS92_9BACT|nr:MAG: pyruvate:ferredoxin (flavodoxin) oxidoreductase [Candidatus Wallbacteria bacterium HGW-Wallbacteria-1]